MDESAEQTLRGAERGCVSGAIVRLVRELLQGLLVAGVAVWATCLLSALWVRHRVRKRLRITPGVRSTAPTVWLVSPTAAARLHHRLRRVGASARAASTLDPALTDLADELIVDALRLEPAVVAVARTGRTGAPVRRGVSARVSELELVARRLTTLSTQAVSGWSEAVRLPDRVGALAAARQELADIELAAGLYSMSDERSSSRKMHSPGQSSAAATAAPTWSGATGAIEPGPPGSFSASPSACT
jgi:hypothetical protein